jgi:hypothetical protein
MPKEWQELVDLDSIRTDPLLQPRDGAELDLENVASLELVVNTPAFQRDYPIHLFRVRGCGDLLVRGHHRLAAAARQKMTQFNAIIHAGEWMDAFWWSRGENRDLGKGRTQLDVRYAAFQAFDLRKSDKYGWFPDAKIAEKLFVSPGRISQLKQEWSGIFNPKDGGRGGSANSPVLTTPPPPRADPPPFQPAAEQTPPPPDLGDAEVEGARKREHTLDAQEDKAPDAPSPFREHQDAALYYLRRLATELTVLSLMDRFRGPLGAMEAAVNGFEG